MIKSLLKKLDDVSKEKDISTPYVCGGIPRDKAIGIIKEIKDIDITTGDKTIHILSKEMSILLKDSKKYFYKTFDDGHSTLITDDGKLDFSSNFIIPGLENILKEKLTSLEKEMFSRDFTINSLLLTLDLKTLIDPTDLGLDDIKKKIIKTCLPAALTLRADPRRVIRAINLAARLNFDVDDDIIIWSRKNKDLLQSVDKRYISEKIFPALEKNKTITLYLIKEMQLLDSLNFSENALGRINNE